VESGPTLPFRGRASIGGEDGAEPMRWRSLGTRTLAAILAVAVPSEAAKAENLAQAWGIALSVNQGLQAQQQTSVSAAFDVKAADSARYVTVRSYSLNTLITSSPTTRATLAGNSTTGTGTGTGTTGTGTTGTTGTTTGTNALGANGALPRVFILGTNQTFLPLSLTNAALPLYTGGKLVKTVEAAQHQFNAQRTEETRTAIDLKLTVAEAYIGVLRARRNLETARSNVEDLASFARDVRNRLDQGLAIRSDDLAAQVSLANAQLNEITSRTALESAYATYNRYLCRPLDAYVELEEISHLPGDANWQEMAAQAVRTRAEFAGMNDAEARELTAKAIQARPELRGLGEQSRSLAAQVEATKANLRPQVSFNGGFLFTGAENFVPQGYGYANFLVDWTFTDSGRTRRQAESLRAQSRSTTKRRADLAADVALQVRTRWLDVQTSRQRVPIARFAVTQVEENVKVVTDRYRQQLSTYTEVLDAEQRRVSGLNSFYNAVYDENLAVFRLRRAVGDI